MTFKQFISLVSAELYNRARVAEGLERSGSHRPGSIVFRASAGLLEAWGRKYAREIEPETAEPKPDVVPLVIIEGPDLDGAEAVMVGAVHAVFVDWYSLEDDAEKCKEVGSKINRYFDSTGLPKDSRVEKILARLSDVISEAEKPSPDEEIIDNEDPDAPTDDNPNGFYKGIPHTGKQGCPACEAFMKDAGIEDPGPSSNPFASAFESYFGRSGRVPEPEYRPSPTMNLSGFFPQEGSPNRDRLDRAAEVVDKMSPERKQQFMGRLVEVIAMMPLDRQLASEKFTAVREEFGLPD